MDQGVTKAMCIECQSADMRDETKMTSLGFVHCKHDGPGEFRSVALPQDCARFSQAKEEIMQPRREWMSKRAQK